MEPSTLPEPIIVDSQTILLAGLREILDQNAAQNIPLLWQNFSPFIGTTPHQVGNNCYGVCSAGDIEQQVFYYLAAVEVADFTELPQVISTMVLPSQRYAVFSHNTHVSRIRETIDAIFDQWLPKANVKHANQALHFFERYDNSYDVQTGLGGMEIWLPIKN